MDPLLFLIFALGSVAVCAFLWLRSRGLLRDCAEKIRLLDSSNISLLATVQEKNIEIQRLSNEMNQSQISHAKTETLWEQATVRVRELEATCSKINTALDESSQKIHRAEANAQSEAAKVQILRDQFSETQKTQDQLKVLAKNEFQVLAQAILYEKTKSFDTQTGNRFTELIRPFKDQIDLFSRSIDEKYSTESKERFSLQGQIKLVVESQQRLSTEANGLSKALRGDSKIQGDWGETVLERILESAGLMDGRDYSAQLNVKDGDGKDQRPDVVINLPADRKLIVDAKVSLKAYSTLPNAASEEEREAILKDHVASIRRHVADLSAKHYQRLDGIHSPDFVFMFIPIEPAYLAAAQFDQNLVTEAWQRKVAIVSSTSLFSSMQVVASLWRLENQNQNAQRIAKDAAGIYDQLARFVEAFEKVGKSLDAAKDAYTLGLSRLSAGKGNVVRRMEALRRLGVAPTKRLSPALLAASGEDDAMAEDVPELSESDETND